MLYIGCAVSQKMRSTLEKLNIPYGVMPSNPSLPQPISSHPDMSAVTVREKTFSSGETAEFLGCTDTGEAFGKSYPYDVLFNGFVLCGRLFCYEKAFSKAALQFAKDNGIEVVNVKQGYAKCSTVVLGDTGIITADKGIAKTAKSICKVLLIDEGGIMLPPYEYGFIGGASFVLGDKVFFFGDIKKHKNADSISRFISECGYTAVSLSDESLCDFGGGVLIND